MFQIQKHSPAAYKKAIVFLNSGRKFTEWLSGHNRGAICQRNENPVRMMLGIENILKPQVHGSVCGLYSKILIGSADALKHFRNSLLQFFLCIWFDQIMHSTHPKALQRMIFRSGCNHQHAVRIKLP